MLGVHFEYNHIMITATGSTLHHVHRESNGEQVVGSNMGQERSQVILQVIVGGGMASVPLVVL